MLKTNKLLCVRTALLIIIGLPPTTALSQPSTTATLPTSLLNGDFESGKEPWFAIDTIQWGDFDIASETLAGEKTNLFAKIAARSVEPHQTLRIFGAVQDFATTTIPKKLTFKMRIANEIAAGNKRYAQAVVVVWPKNGMNVQLRFILYGVDRPPYEMTNARFFMIPRTEEPQKWQEYSLDVAEKFTSLYPEVKEITKVRLLVEARYDDLPRDTKPHLNILEAHYDDVSLK